MTGQGAGLDGGALDVAAVGGPKVGHIEVGHLADLDGAALQLQDQGQGQAATSSGGRVERARAVDSYCLYCGRRMSAGKWGRRLYCCNAHRTAAYKRRRRAAAAVEGVTDGS